MTQFDNGELATDAMSKLNPVIVRKPDPRDSERYIVQRADGYIYSISHYDLLKR